MPSQPLIQSQTSEPGIIGSSRLDVVRPAKDYRRTEWAFEVVVVEVEGVNDVVVVVDDVEKKHVEGLEGWLLA
jgi:hypothetical protein